jgi:hypothetical protein
MLFSPARFINLTGRAAITHQPAGFHGSAEARKWPSKMCKTFT